VQGVGQGLADAGAGTGDQVSGHRPSSVTG
jgi:hypothetical protein